MQREKSIFDKIGSLIPGYRGYAEREGRRQSDKLLRLRIADALDRCASNVQDRIDDALRAGVPDQLGTHERCHKKLDTLAAKIRYAPHGVSSFFSDVQVKEEELLHLYELDCALAQSTDTLTQEIGQLDPNTALTHVDEIANAMDRRNSWLQERK